MLWNQSSSEYTMWNRYICGGFPTLALPSSPHPPLLTLLSSPSSPHPPLLTLLSSPSSPHPPLLTLLSSPSFPHPPLLTLLSSASKGTCTEVPHICGPSIGPCTCSRVVALKCNGLGCPHQIALIS